jgi:hypothetical protein
VKTLVAFILLVLAGSASAQIYECRMPSGNIVQQSGVPCAPGTDTRDAGREADRRKKQEQEARKVEKAREMDFAADRREVRIGMTTEQVLRAWGNPARHVVEEKKSGTRQIWTWNCPDRRRGGSNSVVFQKGAVSAIRMACS